MSPVRLPRRTFLAALAAVSVSCRAGGRAGTDRPLVILFGPNHAPRKVDQLRAQWSSASGLKLEFQIAATDSDAVDAILAGRADAGIVSLFDFLYCAEVHGVQPLAQLIRNGDHADQTGELIVRKDSPLQDLASLKGHKLAYVDPYSVTGFLLPAARLREQGVTAEWVSSGSHEAVVAAVRNGTVAAGATYDGQAKTEPELRVLASTGSIANEPFFVQASLPAEAKDALKKALLATHEPAALEGVAHASSFRAPAEGTYAAALAKVKAIGKVSEDLVPGGWVRANEHRRPLWSFDP